MMNDCDTMDTVRSDHLNHVMHTLFERSFLSPGKTYVNGKPRFYLSGCRWEDDKVGKGNWAKTIAHGQRTATSDVNKYASVIECQRDKSRKADRHGWMPPRERNVSQAPGLCSDRGNRTRWNLEVIRQRRRGTLVRFSEVLNTGMDVRKSND